MNFYETLEAFNNTKMDMGMLRVAYEMDAIFDWLKYTRRDFESMCSIAKEVYYKVNTYDINVVCNVVYDKITKIMYSDSATFSINELIDEVNDRL